MLEYMKIYLYKVCHFIFRQALNNTIKSNVVNSNILVGISLQFSSNNNTVENNVANSNKYIGIGLTSSNKNTIENNTADSNDESGISLKYSSNNIIKNNIANSNNNFGIDLESSNSNVIENNIVNSSIFAGIFLNSSNNIIIKNNIAKLSRYGIWLAGLSDNNIIKNNIANLNNDVGICLLESKNNTVEGNVASNNRRGIYLSTSSLNNVIRNNTILSNKHGIHLLYSIKNTIYHNNLINNIQSEDDNPEKNNWHQPLLLEGNYWSDYDGIDLDGDCIGDTNIPYPEEGYDSYPFIDRDGWLTMSVWPHYLDFGKVYQGTLVNQTFNISNYGNSVLNVSSIKYDNTTIEISGIEPPVLLAKGSSRSFTITLDTETLEGFVLKNIEIISNDLENPHKNITIFGFVEIPAHNIIIRGVDHKSRVIKGQINLFNITITNTGDFREKNVSIEFKEGSRSLGNATIKNIESKENKSAIFKWDTSAVTPKTYDILIEVKLKDKPLSLATLQVPVKVEMPSAAQTLILTNKERLAKFWGAERTEKLENKLIKLSYHVSVAGIPVYVEEDEAVAGAYELWNSSSQDPAKANDVAKRIKDLIDNKLREYTGIRYIILVGDDRIIPYYRILDNTSEPFIARWYIEKDYSKLNKDSIVGSALYNNMFLTDNIYAANGSIEWETAEVSIPELFIPIIPIGRLVESPEDISAVIEAFYRKEYVNPDKIFVTGCDFMKDCASDCSSILNEPRRNVTIVLSEETPNSCQKIKNELLNTSNNLVFLFQHAEHDRVGIPYCNITSQDIYQFADLNNSIICSMGCHSGLNVPQNSSINDFDLVEAFAQKGALAYIAPTGYSIGLRMTKGAHELLFFYLTRHLCEGRDVCTALMLAKQEYWATKYDFDYIDEKVLETTTLYGLPMTRIPRLSAFYSESKVEIKSIEEDMLKEQPDTLVIRPLHTLISTLRGNYYITPSRELLHGPGKPIQPQEIRIFYPSPTKMLHGAVLNSSKYHQNKSFTILIDAYMQSYEESKCKSLTIENWYPAQIFKINSISDPRGPTESRQYLVIITGQYKGRTLPGISGEERIYDELSFDLYYAPPREEKNPPVIRDVSSSRINDSVSITVNASDESGIRRVLVTYTDINGERGEWRSEDCTHKAGDMWICNIPTKEEIEFFVQAVDNVGNVAIKDNDGKYFKK